ncbi:MAG TPA: 50S ribosomal protein L6 [Alphaproteobacteria bacterium]|jgi:large subunit ribosomal protein L6
MSRVGKNPVKLPSGVTVNVSGQEVTAKGKLGQLSMIVSKDVEALIDGDSVLVKPRDESKRSRMLWGMTRNMISNMVTGVATGYTVNLEINGVGYRAAVQGKVLNMQLGYSHDINYPIPEGITIKCEKPTAISISGADRQKVGQVAAEIRGYRKPEPYKGKGIKYDHETILRKEGKKK